MFSRILFSAIAATLLTAAPALATDRGASKDPCSCCSDGSIHESDHPLRHEQLKKEPKKGAPERSAQPRTTEDDPNVRNQSWGG